MSAAGASSEYAATRGPTGAPVACGALGSYDAERVRRIAARLGDGVRPVHEDERSILFCDREPIVWTGEDERGYAWIEGDVWRGAPSTWEEAARLGGWGLAFGRRRRLVHSSISGVAPLYWIEDRGVTYFASRIDPLVRAWPRALSVDWDAWAATIALRYPLGDRTPFAEVRRLRPYAALGRRLGRARILRPAWPWPEVEPRASLDAGADAWVEALRDTLAPLGPRVLCPLSGGRDSRMLLCALPDRGEALALTVSDDEGGVYEEERATRVASALGVRHELIGARAEDYPRDWDQRAAAVEYQFVDHAWLMPLAHRLAGAEEPVLDGLAIDTLFAAGERFYIGDAIDTSRPRVATGALFDTLRQFGHAERALEPAFEAPLVARARDQFVAELRPFEGHSSQVILGTYVTRTLRGAAAYPTSLLGTRARVIAPGIGDDLVRAALSIPLLAKQGATLYRSVFERLAPEVVEIPRTGGDPRAPIHLPRRWRSDAAVTGYRELLYDGPLARHLAPAMRAWLDDPARGELDGHLRMGMESIALLHAWCRRYRDQLGDVDAAALAA